MWNLTSAVAIHALTLNIWGLPNLPSKDLTPNRTGRIQAICQELTRRHQEQSLDLVFIQEAWLKGDRKTLKKCGFIHVLDMDSGSLDSGVMILSRYPFDTNSFKRVTYRSQGRFDRIFADGEILASKSFITGKIMHPELGMIRVATTHLVSTYSAHHDIYQNRRRKQLTEMKNHLDKWTGQDALIVGGDFNFGPEQTMLWSILTRNWQDDPETRHLCTYQDRDNISCKIDHILVNDKLRVADSRISFNNFRYSDHFGYESTIYGIPRSTRNRRE